MYSERSESHNSSHHSRGTVTRIRMTQSCSGGRERQRAGAFRADQRPRDVKTVFRQQIVEIVAGNPARNFRIAARVLVAITLGQRAQLLVNLGAAAAGSADGFECIIRCGADSRLQAVARQNVELLDIVDRLAAPKRVRAAGIVADIAANRAVLVGRGVGCEGQPERRASSRS